jgi:two-component system, OmpR family, sensor kinase
MATSDNGPSVEDYAPLLGKYLHAHDEEALYRASLLSRTCIESGLGPEDIIALHFEGLERAMQGLSYREQARASADAHQFLLEVMIAYGVQFKDYLELKLAETLRDAETRSARERERAQEAERLERERQDILAVIAHELGTPLTAARGNIDMATRSLSRGRLDSVPRYLGTAQEAIERLSRLSADLVESSRGERHEIELSAQPLTPIVTKACAWAYPSAAAKEIALVHEPGELSLDALANADALLSILGNLLSNAIRYTPSGGTVRVCQGCDEVSVWVEVSDTGIGMAPEVRERIFEKFYRGPEARQVATRGLGLGLALVQQLAAAHDGSVEVASVAGAGSTFRLRLPLPPGTGTEGDHGTGE